MRMEKVLFVICFFFLFSFFQVYGNPLNDVNPAPTNQQTATPHLIQSNHSCDNPPADPHNETHEDHHGVHLVSWRWKEYHSYVIITLVIIGAVIIKIGYHHITTLPKTSHLRVFSTVFKILPESVVLILLGIVMAVIMEYLILDGIFPGALNPFPRFTANMFFNILLPPIILDSAVALYDREFLSNVKSILTFAIFGTLFNVFSIGMTLYGLGYSGVFGSFTVGEDKVEHQLTATQCLIFSSLISAVDPVAVLAIFEEIHVNMALYFLVFGESLLNDGVTVVLYNTMITMENIPAIGPLEVFMSIASFFFVVFGGLFIGMMFGVLCSYITTYTEEVRVVEPLLIFSTAYMAFLCAELVHWSGIISIIGFGLVARRYAFGNISQKSYHTVKYATKTMASTSDCIIFLYLGVVLIQEDQYWHPGFIIATIISCILYRFISTFFFSWLVNCRRANEISLPEQFVMAYGGLRGAVGFSLAVVLKRTEDNWYRELFVSTALTMVFFTVFLQGSTIKFLVKWLHIKLQRENTTRLVSIEVHKKLMYDLMAGVETIIGHHGTWESWEYVRYLDANYISNVLVSDHCKEDLQRRFEKICLDDHYTHLYAPTIIANEATKNQGIERFRKSESVVADLCKVFKDTNRDLLRGTDNRNLMNRLDMRADRAKTLERQVFTNQTIRRRRRAFSDVTQEHSVNSVPNATEEPEAVSEVRMFAEVGSPLIPQPLLRSPTGSTLSPFTTHGLATIMEDYNEMQAIKKMKMGSIMDNCDKILEGTSV